MTEPTLPPGHYSPLVNPPMDPALLRVWEQTTPDVGHAQIYQRLRRAIEVSNAQNQAVDQASQTDRTELRGLIEALTVRVEALEALRLRGTTGNGSVTSLIAGTSTATVPLKTPMPDATWMPFVWIDATTGLNLASVTATVTARTATTATVRIANAGLGIATTVNFTVLALSLT